MMTHATAAWLQLDEDRGRNGGPRSLAEKEVTEHPIRRLGGREIREEQGQLLAPPEEMVLAPTQSRVNYHGETVWQESSYRLVAKRAAAAQSSRKIAAVLAEHDRAESA